MFLLTMMDSYYGVLKLKNIGYWMRNKLSIDFYLSEDLLQHYSIVIVI